MMTWWYKLQTNIASAFLEEQKSSLIVKMKTNLLYYNWNDIYKYKYKQSSKEFDGIFEKCNICF